MSKHSEKANRKIARLMQEHGIEEVREFSNSYSYHMRGHVAAVYMPARQTTAQLPWNAETENWMGYFASLPEAQLAAVEALATEE